VPGPGHFCWRLHLPLLDHLHNCDSHHGPETHPVPQGKESGDQARQVTARRHRKSLQLEGRALLSPRALAHLPHLRRLLFSHLSFHQPRQAVLHAQVRVLPRLRRLPAELILSNNNNILARVRPSCGSNWPQHTLGGQRMCGRTGSPFRHALHIREFLRAGDCARLVIVRHCNSPVAYGVRFGATEQAGKCIWNDAECAESRLGNHFHINRIPG